MKNLIIVLVATALVVSAIAFTPDHIRIPQEKKYPMTEAFKPIAVIELFTSQGCSSCPAADQLLSKTMSNAKKNSKNILAISFHVDYWNKLGWSDPFSSEEYSARQRAYAEHFNLSSVYTPQILFNGTKEFVGSDESKLNAALQLSLNTTPAVAFKTLECVSGNDAIPSVKFSLDGDYADCTINFALIAISETTSIKRGENVGRTVTNENVVRQFISTPATATGEISFKKSPLPLRSNTAVVAYVQRKADLKIIGGAEALLK